MGPKTVFHVLFLCPAVCESWVVASLEGKIPQNDACSEFYGCLGGTEGDNDVEVITISYVAYYIWSCGNKMVFEGLINPNKRVVN